MESMTSGHETRVTIDWIRLSVQTVCETSVSVPWLATK